MMTYTHAAYTLGSTLVVPVAELSMKRSLRLHFTRTIL